MSEQQPSTPEPVASSPSPAPKPAAEPTTSTLNETSTPPKEASTPAQASDRSLLNDEVAAGAPEKYDDFKVPEGFQLDQAVAEEASAIFRDLNLPQAAAQRLVDFYTAKTKESFEAPFQAYAEMRKGWRDEVSAHKFPDGRTISQVKANVARTIDGLGDPALARSFREAMDLTGAGDNPAFIRVFDLLAAKLSEGTHVTGAGPSPAGQPGPRAPRTLAEAMYPNLTGA